MYCFITQSKRRFINTLQSTGITDIETGPDGFLYVLTHDRETGDGNLYRIVLGASGAPDTTTPPIIEETPAGEEEEDENEEEEED